MSDPKLARKLADLAIMDLTAASHMFDRGAFADPVFGFHCQQAVEKAFKAWICLEGIVYPPVHDLQILYKLLEPSNEETLPRFRDLVDLTDFAVSRRYELFDDEPVDRETLIQTIRELVDLVRDLIPSL